MMNESEISHDHESRFLGVPLEIRRHIYRYLLLHPSESYLSPPPWHEKGDSEAKENHGERSNDEMWQGTEYQGSFYEHNYNDSDSDVGYNVLDGSSRIRNVKATSTGESEVQDEDGIFSNQEVKPQRYLAILRTNRQIYNEASSVLYSELCATLQPGDILCMNTGKDIVEASRKVWRHNPLQGTGTTNHSGLTVYAAPELDGVMEPHVFARFERVACELEFNWELESLAAHKSRRIEEDPRNKAAPTLFVNDNLTVNPEDEAKLLAFLKRSTIIHQLVKILSNSTNIVSLDITICIEVLALYDMDSDWDSEEDDDGSAAEDTYLKMSVANERATELFLDSGLLAPMEKLSNVRSINFGFSDLNRNDEPYEATAKHSEMLLELKQKVEHNYVLKKE